MKRIEIVDSGLIYRRDSAFPTLVRLDDGDILCGFSVGGGPDVEGGTELARSRDGGRTWTWEGPILPPTEEPPTCNSLRLSRTADGLILAYGQRNYRAPNAAEFGQARCDPVLCTSTDGGRTWSAPAVIPSAVPGPFEISNPIVVLADGRWLAPAATLPDPKRFGERVIAFESADRGRTWPATRTVLVDPEGVKGFFEQKLTQLDPGRVMAVAWTVTLGDYRDFDDHFAISTDGGRTWGPPRPTGIRGQTMTPTWLGGDQLLVVYNRRHGDQGVRAALVRFTDQEWHVEYEDFVYDAKASYQRPADVTSGIKEFDSFAFGLPSAMRLDERNFLAVHWCKEEGIFGIRWTRLHVE